MGFFGSCQKKTKQSVQIIKKLGKDAIFLGQNIQQLTNVINSKFFRKSRESDMLQGIQRHINETQNENWRATELQLNVLKQIFHKLHNGHQRLHAKQVNFNFYTISSLLSLIYSIIKSYSGALYAYQKSIINPIHYVPMSLLPKESPVKILQQVATEC